MIDYDKYKDVNSGAWYSGVSSDDDFDCDIGWIITDGSGKCIAKVHKDNGIANKKLIADAPAMLNRCLELEEEKAELVEALKCCLYVIKDYIEYEHDGDPWSEDSRAMGEMEIDDFYRDGRYEKARQALNKAKGGE